MKLQFIGVLSLVFRERCTETV